MTSCSEGSRRLARRGRTSGAATRVSPRRSLRRTGGCRQVLPPRCGGRGSSSAATNAIAASDRTARSLCIDCKRIGAGSHPDVTALAPEVAGQSHRHRPRARAHSHDVAQAHEPRAAHRDHSRRASTDDRGAERAAQAARRAARRGADRARDRESFRVAADGALALSDLSVRRGAGGRHRRATPRRGSRRRGGRARGGARARQRRTSARAHAGGGRRPRRAHSHGRNARRRRPARRRGPDGCARRAPKGREGRASRKCWPGRCSRIEAAFGHAPPAESAELAPILAATTPDDASRLLERAERVHWTLDALARNANPKLAIRDLLLRLEAR